MIEHVSVDFSHALLDAYAEACKPVCREIQMPQTAFDILMFLSNNPSYNTARDIVAVRGLKANLVSVNVDKLVKEGFLERRPDKTDRRKTILLCTELAQPVVEKGSQFQQAFVEGLFQGVSEEERTIYSSVMEKLRVNLSRIVKEKQKQ